LAEVDDSNRAGRYCLDKARENILCHENPLLPVDLSFLHYKLNRFRNLDVLRRVAIRHRDTLQRDVTC
jgi:hypothetical protein